ncbi:MAG TPA: nicotinate phosphoribosyltransferase, partial [Candidatus Nitrosocosmicus sp.]|nr:nicotinate phosphoribosyltransferase [Candidatus Nitrosocosmicus sp.]
AVEYISNFTFNKDQIDYLKSLDVFRKIRRDFYDYLLELRFTGNLWAVPEGTVLFPNEPILRIEAPIIEAQLLETFLLSTINFQTLIASKASKICNIAGYKPIIEFGSRRAHGPQAALLAARAAFIGGCVGTSNTLAGMQFGIPVYGTMAHSFIMSFENEIIAFKEFQKLFPDGFLLVDTFDTLNAIKMIIREGISPKGVRLDSGDLLYLSKKVREMLDAADDISYRNTKIMASGDLNENIIRELLKNNAPIDSFAVGTELTTSRDSPVLNGVYKMVAIRVQRKDKLDPSNKDIKLHAHITADVNRKAIIYKVKTSPSKHTFPGPKQIHRIIDNKGILVEDVISLADEPMEGSLPLLEKIIENGSIVKSLPPLSVTQQYHKKQIQMIPFLTEKDQEQSFPVSFSQKLVKLAKELGSID